MLPTTLRVGSFQFATSGDITANLAALERGMAAGAREGVRVLLTQECGLCGYPPIERDAAATIDQPAQQAGLEHIAALARRYDLFIVVGLITPHGHAFRNSLCLVSPDESDAVLYHKRALWGWDMENFVPGNAPGVCEIDGVTVGLRVCYEARFPEYFRELFRRQVSLALVALSNVGDAERRDQTDVYRAHLVSRASENAIWVLSANSCSRAQLAPSCLIDPDGNVMAECKTDHEEMIFGDVTIGEPSFSAKGRIALSKKLTEHREEDQGAD